MKSQRNTSNSYHGFWHFHGPTVDCVLKVPKLSPLLDNLHLVSQSAAAGQRGGGGRKAALYVRRHVQQLWLCKSQRYNMTELLYKYHFQILPGRVMDVFLKPACFLQTALCQQNNNRKVPITLLFSSYFQMAEITGLPRLELLRLGCNVYSRSVPHQGHSLPTENLNIRG